MTFHSLVEKYVNGLCEKKHSKLSDYSDRYLFKAIGLRPTAVLVEPAVDGRTYGFAIYALLMGCSF